MYCRVLSASLLGVEALPIQVEVDVAGGLPFFVTVGLAEGAVKEAKVRVQSAIQNSGHCFSVGRVTMLWKKNGNMIMVFEIFRLYIEG